MCGRTACTLCPDDIRRASRYTSRRTGNRQTPRWHSNPGQSYQTSYNIAPGATTPVIVSAEHVTKASGKEPTAEHIAKVSGKEPTEELKEDTCTERVIFPMRWGLVPSWYKGELKTFSLKTTNCRSDNMLTSRIFKVPLEKGRRCVVVVDGFYEWNPKDKNHPYFIYFHEEAGSKRDDLKNVTCDQKQSEPKHTEEDVSKEDVCDVESENQEWAGKRLLTMAGVFDVSHPKDTEGEPFYSYSVVTVDASPAMKHIHHRMPAILNNDDEVQKWLEFGEVSLKEAVKLIQPSEMVTFHQVSSKVNNSRYKEADCMERIDPHKKSAPTGLTTWLKKDSKDEKKNSKRISGTDLTEKDEPPAKKSKT